MIAALACVAWATDFSHMNTERLMNMRGNVSPNECPAFEHEMQKRMQRMTPQQRQYYMNSGYGMGGNSMMKMMTFREFRSKSQWTYHSKRIPKRTRKVYGTNAKNAWIQCSEHGKKLYEAHDVF